MAKQDNVQFQFPDSMGLRMAALYADISEQRLRILVREGKITATQNEKGQWMVDKEAIDTYKANRRTGGSGIRKPSADGKSWVIKVKVADFDQVVAALEPFGITLEPRYNYEAQKAYQAKRRAEKAAAKAAAAVTGEQ